MHLHSECEAHCRSGFLQWRRLSAGDASATCDFFEEKLQIQVNIWYKVSRFERV